MSVLLVTYLFCLYVSIASAMGNWCAQFAPAIYCVILETTSGASGTATEERKINKVTSQTITSTALHLLSQAADGTQPASSELHLPKEADCEGV